MRIVLVVPADARHPELTTYACRACGEVVTEVDRDGCPGAPDRGREIYRGVSTAECHRRANSFIDGKGRFTHDPRRA